MIAFVYLLSGAFVWSLLSLAIVGFMLWVASLLRRGGGR